LYTRGKEHQRNYSKEEAESFKYKHQKDRHHGAEANFTVEVKASLRIVAEGVHIRRCEKELFLSLSLSLSEPGARTDAKSASSRSPLEGS
jgi:hypothetical protein